MKCKLRVIERTEVKFLYNYGKLRKWKLKESRLLYSFVGGVYVVFVIGEKQSKVTSSSSPYNFVVSEIAICQGQIFDVIVEFLIVENHKFINVMIAEVERMGIFSPETTNMSIQGFTFISERRQVCL